MKQFLCEDFLLSTNTARTLYRDYAEDMPILDYHCHVSPREIAEDRVFDNIAQVWLSGDHYKWRIMRACGVAEEFITGDAPDYEKFIKFAQVLPRAIGNPIYHWTHLELKRYFDCDLVLSPENAEEIWKICNDRLQSGLTVRKMIKEANVTGIGTTDEPVDSLEWHIQMKNDVSWDVEVRPSFRPDRALNIDKPGFLEYIGKLGQSAGINIKTVEDVRFALKNRMEYFHKNGCRISDHGLDYMAWRKNGSLTRTAFSKALNREKPTKEEAEAYKTELLMFCGREYRRLNWVMQLHYNVCRSVNTAMFRAVGADTGFDCISTLDGSGGLPRLLDGLAVDDSLPKTILYSLNPADNMFLATLANCFPGTQNGAAWWFNDTKKGMVEQLTAFADVGVLGNFVGMLTDSRSFLSYTRHEYFRRILCDVLGGLVENGEYPPDFDALGGIVKDICYNNAKRYFYG